MTDHSKALNTRLFVFVGARANTCFIIVYFSQPSFAMLTFSMLCRQVDSVYVWAALHLVRRLTLFSTGAWVFLQLYIFVTVTFLFVIDSPYESLYLVLCS